MGYSCTKQVHPSIIAETTLKRGNSVLCFDLKRPYQLFLSRQRNRQVTGLRLDGCYNLLWPVLRWKIASFDPPFCDTFLTCYIWFITLHPIKNSPLSKRGRFTMRKVSVCLCACSTGRVNVCKICARLPMRTHGWAHKHSVDVRQQPASWLRV